MTRQTLRPNQRIALAALVETGNASAAATAASVSRDTLHRWLRSDPLFLDTLRDLEAEQLRALTRRLLALGGKATATVEAVLDNPDASAANRLKAADIVIGRLLQLRELVDLESRIRTLEERMEAQHGQP